MTLTQLFLCAPSRGTIQLLGQYYEKEIRAEKIGRMADYLFDDWFWYVNSEHGTCAVANDGAFIMARKFENR